ncbi:hypothetical protein MMPV_003941 [Pyropia vietnamensis]
MRVSWARLAPAPPPPPPAPQQRTTLASLLSSARALLGPAAPTLPAAPRVVASDVAPRRLRTPTASGPTTPAPRPSRPSRPLRPPQTPPPSLAPAEAAATASAISAALGRLAPVVLADRPLRRRKQAKARFGDSSSTLARTLPDVPPIVYRTPPPWAPPPPPDEVADEAAGDEESPSQRRRRRRRRRPRGVDVEVPKAAAAFRAAARRDAEAAAQMAALAAEASTTPAASISATAAGTDGWNRLGVADLPIVPHIPDDEDRSLVPTLAHGLNRVLETPGLHLAWPALANLDAEVLGGANAGGCGSGAGGRQVPSGRLPCGVSGATGRDPAMASAGAATAAPVRWGRDGRLLPLGRAAEWAIAQPSAINWSAIPRYVIASEDTALTAAAARTSPQVAFVSSTSSMTGLFSALYRPISNWRDTGLVPGGGGLGSEFANEAGGFVAAIGRPVAVGLRVRERRNGGRGRDGAGGFLWAVDQEKGMEDGCGILMNLGHSLERMLTMERGVFEDKLLLRNAPALRGKGGATAGDAGTHTDGGDNDPASTISADTTIATPNAPDHGTSFYHYTTVGAFLLRAQIDARHDTNGSVFDIKTRALAAIRYDASNYAAHARTTPFQIVGRSRSYAREFYDLTRSSMLKYALQLRIGRMDGALVAYHNTGSLLAFEYVRLSEMDAYVFGSAVFADAAFRGVAAAAEVVCRAAVEGDLGRAVVAAAAHGDHLKVVVEPLRSRRSVAVYVQRVRGGVDPVGPDAFREHFVVAHRRDRRRRGMGSAGGTGLAPAAVSQAGSSGGDGGPSTGPPSPSGACETDDGLFSSTAWSDEDGLNAPVAAGDMDENAVGASAFAVVAPRGGGGINGSSSGTDTDDLGDQPESVEEAHAEANEAGASAGLPSVWRSTPPVDEADLAAWELRLTPVVNGQPTTDAVSLDVGDAYEVLSRLTPVPVDGAVVLDYLDALKRAYYYKNPLLREHAWKGKGGDEEE